MLTTLFCVCSEAVKLQGPDAAQWKAYWEALSREQTLEKKKKKKGYISMLTAHGFLQLKTVISKEN